MYKVSKTKALSKSVWIFFLGFFIACNNPKEESHVLLEEKATILQEVPTTQVFLYSSMKDFALKDPKPIEVPVTVGEAVSINQILEVWSQSMQELPLVRVLFVKEGAVYLEIQSENASGYSLAQEQWILWSLLKTLFVNSKEAKRVVFLQDQKQTLTFLHLLVLPKIVDRDFMNGLENQLQKRQP